jgi:hypothetical protein
MKHDTLRPMRKFLSLPLLLGALMSWCEAQTPKNESFLRPSDVIALVGGEDMVAADEYGYLEYFLQRALPKHRLKFRCLAWEGDTVFEQPRMLNYPTLEQQLDQIGATVLFTQFGQAETLGTGSGNAAFLSAYDALLDRLGNKPRNEGRRTMLFFPTPVAADHEKPAASSEAGAFFAVIEQNRGIRGCWFGNDFRRLNIRDFLRDGMHLNERGHAMVARVLTAETTDPTAASREEPVPDLAATRLPLATGAGEKKLLELIRAKNRFWNNYRRPQNWAFLAGDRTEQPSSRDHIDRNKRWFPEEMKQWLPLIEAKENEIWKLAAELAGK